MIENYINKVIQGDCLEVMKEIPDKNVDMVLTSPPYDNLRDYKGYTFNFEGIAQEIYRVLKDGGVCVWIVGDATIKGSETGTSFKQALYFKEIGFNLHDTMIWEKNTSAFPARKDWNRYTQIFEYMFVLSKWKPRVANLICDKQNKRAWYTSRWTISKRDWDELVDSWKQIQVANFSPRNNIWKIQSSKWSCSKDKFVWHPAWFPTELVEWHMLTRTNEWDVVLDPFAWSWTTWIVATKLNRKYILIEKEKKYYDIICSQLNGWLFW